MIWSGIGAAGRAYTRFSFLSGYVLFFSTEDGRWMVFHGGVG